MAASLDKASALDNTLGAAIQVESLLTRDQSEERTCSNGETSFYGCGLS